MIGEKLKSILEEKNMRQIDLARASGISTSQIANIVNGKIKHPRFDTMEALADALGVSLDAFRSCKRKGGADGKNQTASNPTLSG